MAMFRGATADDSKAEINVTPLIDVLLVLLIIFMVITPLSPSGFDTLVPQPPQHNSTPLEPRSEIAITVRGDKTVGLNSESVDLANLPERLNRISKSSAAVVFLSAGPDLEFRDVATVIDMAKGAGLNRIALLTSRTTN